MNLTTDTNIHILCVSAYVSELQRRFAFAMLLIHVADSPEREACSNNENAGWQATAMRRMEVVVVLDGNWSACATAHIPLVKTMKLYTTCSRDDSKRVRYTDALPRAAGCTLIALNYIQVKRGGSVV